MIKSTCLVLMSNLCCSNAGQVRKSLTIKAHADGTGYLISLSKYSFCLYLHDLLKFTYSFCLYLIPEFVLFSVLVEVVLNQFLYQSSFLYIILSRFVRLDVCLFMIGALESCLLLILPL